VASADVSFTLRFSDDGTGEAVSAQARSRLEVQAGPRTYDVTLLLVCSEGGEIVAERQWFQQFPRDLA
jgi:hypothetical protein